MSWENIEYRNKQKTEEIRITFDNYSDVKSSQIYDEEVTETQGFKIYIFPTRFQERVCLPIELLSID